MKVWRECEVYGGVWCEVCGGSVVCAEVVCGGGIKRVDGHLVCYHVYVCTCLYMFAHVCICLHMLVYVCTCLYMFAHACICLHMFVYVCTCLYIHWLVSHLMCNHIILKRPKHFKFALVIYRFF